jgi:hypothetical protein
MGLELTADGLAVYEPDGAVLRGFMLSNSRVRIVRGPIRSGTSSMCCHEIWRRACEQAPGADGVRRTRWFVIRNTYPELEQSTVRTWLGWFPEKEFGRFIRSKPMMHAMRKPGVHCEVVFLALDKPEDVSKLRSTEWTGGWFNELEYIARELFDEAESRIGYYPALKDGGATWAGLIADMNAPTEDNWVVMMTGDVPLPEDMPEDERKAFQWPEDWDYFVQPPGLIEIFGPDGKTVEGYKLNPLAENLKWIPKPDGVPLYLQTIKGKSKRWIDSRIMNRITAPVDGMPVLSMFVEETHVAKRRLEYNSGWPIYVGLDFGRKPAAVFGQMVGERWQVLGELSGLDEGATTFAPRVRRWLVQNCPGLLYGGDPASVLQAIRDGRLKLFGDPKGQDKVQSDETTAYDVFATFGLKVLPAPVPSNNIETRLAVWEAVLNGMRDGQPRFLMSPDARKLKMALGGGYCWDKGDNERKVPNKKNGYSDLPDAGGYMLLGAGEGAAMVGRARPALVAAQPVKAFGGRRSLRRVS